MTPRSLQRALHPAAWWLWGILVGAGALHITNPLLSALLIAAIWVVVVARRRDVPWARSFGRFLTLGVFVVGVRLVLQALFAPRVPGHVLVTLPEVGLPEWMAGVSLGGPVTAEALLGAFYDSLRLLGLLAAIGAANSLADPYRLLRVLPAALYEAGVAITVALSLTPQALASAAQVRDARRLRGRPTTGLAAARGIALPVLEGALDRSVSMAASMDARGFGRRDGVEPGRRRATRVASALGLLALAVGTYGVLDAGAPAGLAYPALAAGGALLCAALLLGGGRAARTAYRPDPWAGPEWATVTAGAAVLAGLVVASRLGVDLTASVYPLEAPGFPLMGAAVVLLAAVPVLATPEPSR